ncbi:brct domain-containing DNA repair protein-related [Citrus sinensis]|nr:brct domain-containing DNA repair protein-related [Citrus sinensis]
MGGGGRVEVVSSKGCSRLFLGSVPSLRRLRGGVQSFESMSPASSSLASDSVLPANAPFSGLVICVTGLSKEARKQVMEATERLGGHFGGRKFEHALKHGSRNGLYIVTLGWFVDSVRRNVRLSESLYTVKSIDEHGMHLDKLNRLVGFAGTENSCLPAGIYEAKQFNATGKHERDSNRSMNSTLSGCSMYVDSDVSEELRNKVFEAAANEGATLVNQWFVGCGASYVVCEEDSVQKYMGHSNNLVTPVWVLKTAKEKHVQRLVHISADLARQVGMMLENIQNGIARETCQTPIRPLTPSSLLDSICWSISEPTSTASIYTDSFSGEDVNEHHPSVFFDAEADGKDSEASFANLTRMLTESEELFISLNFSLCGFCSEKSELIFKNHFLTILFPVDRFAEMGPSSRTYFSDNGFTCLQVLDYIYEFYQESMSAHEVESAIHTDSRHSDRLRAVYASKETAECGYVTFRRIEFLGSRKSFEMLKRVSGDNNSNVYELLLRA